MAILNDLYQISFSSKDVEEFNKIFAIFLQNSISNLNLPNFKLDCNKERIVILLPADPTSFSFIAQIIKEIDNFSMAFVSGKNADISHDEKKSANSKNLNSDSSIETDALNSSVDDCKIQDNDIKNKEKSCAKQIMDYIFKLKSFSTAQIKKQFPSISTGTINGALQFAKRKGLIKSTSRGNYEVISNKDNTPED